MRKSVLAAASHAILRDEHEGFADGDAISALAALAQPTRLAIFRLLIRHEPAGLSAGVIAETIGAPHNTLSSHLAILVRAGLLHSTRDGRTINYRSNVEGMRALLGFLVNDCCDGHPEVCDLSPENTGKACRPSGGPRSPGAKRPSNRRSQSGGGTK